MHVAMVVGPFEELAVRRENAVAERTRSTDELWEAIQMCPSRVRCEAEQQHVSFGLHRGGGLEEGAQKAGELEISVRAPGAHEDDVPAGHLLPWAVEEAFQVFGVRPEPETASKPGECGCAGFEAGERAF
jgi:hypothetical protein